MTKRYMDYLPESFIVELTDGPNDSISPVNGGEADDMPNPFDTKNGRRALQVGDPVVVKNMRYEGSTGKIINIQDGIAVVALDFDAGKHKFNVTDLEFNHHPQQEKEDSDRELENLRRLAGYQ